MLVHGNKGIRISDKHYTLDFDHEAVCKLQSMLILCHNTATGLTQEDKAFLRAVEKVIEQARNQGEPA